MRVGRTRGADMGPVQCTRDFRRLMGRNASKIAVSFSVYMSHDHRSLAQRGFSLTFLCHCALLLAVPPAGVTILRRFFGRAHAAAAALAAASSSLRNRSSTDGPRLRPWAANAALPGGRLQRQHPGHHPPKRKQLFSWFSFCFLFRAHSPKPSLFNLMFSFSLSLLLFLYYLFETISLTPKLFGDAT